ncbi:hypothetical protein [Planctomycetes bacterium TBK1r]|uniref:Uncharacterized protein n=1 Tax=Stieleria magnilauensis TaxID=2527963 RepID=A0ABX5XZE3_9BACT|nr:hypothetical protein TBK1r_64490 [Planctomycetes bacterium TBK1r]
MTNALKSVRDRILKSQRAKQDESANEQELCLTAMRACVRGEDCDEDHITAWVEKQSDPVGYHDRLEAECKAELKREQVKHRIAEREPELADAWNNVRRHSAEIDETNRDATLVRQMREAKSALQEKGGGATIEDYHKLRAAEARVQNHRDLHDIARARVNVLTREIDGLRDSLKPTPKPIKRREAFYVGSDGKEVRIDGDPSIVEQVTGYKVQYRLV